MSFRIQYRPMLRLRTQHLLKAGTNAVKTLESSVFFQLKPSPSTLALCQEHGILLREREQGIDLFYKFRPNLGAMAGILHPLKGRQRFSFQISAAASAKAGFWLKNSPLHSKQLYCNNLNADTILANNSHVATLDADLSVEPHDFQSQRLSYLNIRPSRFEIITARGDNDYPYNSFTVKDQEDKGADDLMVTLDKTFNPATIYSTVDVTNFPLGRYIIEDNLGNTLQQMYLSDELYQEKAIGVVDIFWDGPQASVQANPNDPPDFRTYELILNETR